MKNRLFVFGDSWAINYFSKTNDLVDCKPFFNTKEVESYVSHYNYFGHWIDHMKNFYDVYSYAMGGVSNEQIIYQLGNLPEYHEGDRMIIMFTGVERYVWIHNKFKYTFCLGSLMPDKIIDEKYVDYFKKQYVERYEYWMDDSISNDEKKFLNMFPKLFKQYQPIVVTWRPELAQKVDSIELIRVDKLNLTSIEEETKGVYKDRHLGVRGNYELFKFLCEKLKLDISNYMFKVINFNKELI